MSYEKHRPDHAPDPAIRRLSLYLRQLEMQRLLGATTISSRTLGDQLHLTDAQVRKDFTHFGQFGQPGVGYRVDDLVNKLRKILGTDRTWNVLLIGAGNLGRALVSHQGFEARGLKLSAVFDIDPAKIGTMLGDMEVQPVSELVTTAHRLKIRLGILAAPPDAAQLVTDLMVYAGLEGILNFAPLTLQVPPNIAVQHVDLAAQLEQLVFHVHRPELAAFSNAQATLSEMQVSQGQTDA